MPQPSRNDAKFEFECGYGSQEATLMALVWTWGLPETKLRAKGAMAGLKSSPKPYDHGSLRAVEDFLDRHARKP